MPTPKPSSSLARYLEPTPAPEWDPINARQTGYPGYNDFISGRAEQPAIDPVADVLAPGLANALLSNASRAALSSEAGAMGRPMYHHLPPEIIEELRQSAVTRNGRPIRVYHGTPDEIVGPLDPARVDNWDIGGSALSFTEQPRAASRYSRVDSKHPADVPNVLPAYLKAKKVLDWKTPMSRDDILDARLAVHNLFDEDVSIPVRPMSGGMLHEYLTRIADDLYQHGSVSQERVRALLAEMGYDGMKFQEYDHGKHLPYTTWQVFKPEQVIEPYWEPKLGRRTK